MKLSKIVFCCISILLSCSLLSNSISASAITSREICDNAYKLYNVVWTPLIPVQTSINFQHRPSMFIPGNEYHIPYGQPTARGYYIGYDIVNEVNVDYLPVYSTCVTSSSFLAATKDSNSPFYNQRGYGAIGDCPYYSLDCSGYVSICWDLTKKYCTQEFAFGGDGPERASSRPIVAQDLGCVMDIAEHLGVSYDTNGRIIGTVDKDDLMRYVNKCTGLNECNLEGYALCKPKDHIVLFGNNSNGEVYYDILEEIPYQLTCTCLSITEIFQKYQRYNLYRLYDMEEHKN